MSSIDFSIDDVVAEDEDTDLISYHDGRECISFVVDCSVNMFKTKLESLTCFHFAMKFIRDLLNKKCVRNDKDLVSIVLYGTEKAENNVDVPNVFVLHKLSLPDSDLVKQIDSFVEDLAYFQSEYGTSDQYSLGDVFWVCQRIFIEMKIKDLDYRILFITCDDNPHGSDSKLRKKALKRFGDVLPYVQMDIVPLGENFSASKFYEHIADQVDDKNVDSVVLNICKPLTEDSDLSSMIESERPQKRSLGSVLFSLGPDINLSVNIYNLFGKRSLPSKDNRYAATNEPVFGHRLTHLKDSEQPLLTDDIVRYQQYGGQRIGFDAQEIKAIKEFSTSGMKLIGFKPQNLMKTQYHVRSSLFIFPNEKVITGSTNLFLALLKKCIERGVVAVCSLTARKLSPPKLVYLLPQAGSVADELPSGFHIIFMPFADDFRSLDSIKAATKPPLASTEQVEKAKAVVKSLKFSYRPENFDNPALKKFYLALETFALGKDSVETLEDSTEPKLNAIAEQAGNAIAELRDFVYPENYHPRQLATAKRAASNSASAAAKKSKDDSKPVDLKTSAEEGTLGKLTVAELKDSANKWNIKLWGTKKADIIEEIKRHFS